MSKAELVEIECHDDTNPQFFGDVRFTGDSRPPSRKQQHWTSTSGGPLQVTLLSLTCNVQQHGKHKNCTGIDVWNVVVMDQTFGVFKVVLNSGLSRDTPHEELHVGSTVVIVDWTIVWNTDLEEGWKCSVLFIRDFDWSPAPHDAPKMNDGANGMVSLHFCKAWVNSKAIERVKKESVMLFLESFQHDDGALLPLG